MSLHPGLFFCFHFFYGISRLRHFGNLKKRRRVFFKIGFFLVSGRLFLSVSLQGRETLSKHLGFSRWKTWIPRTGCQDRASTPSTSPSSGRFWPSNKFSLSFYSLFPCRKRRKMTENSTSGIFSVETFSVSLPFDRTFQRTENPISLFFPLFLLFRRFPVRARLKKTDWTVGAIYPISSFLRK